MFTRRYGNRQYAIGVRLTYSNFPCSRYRSVAYADRESFRRNSPLPLPLVFINEFSMSRGCLVWNIRHSAGDANDKYILLLHGDRFFDR